MLQLQQLFIALSTCFTVTLDEEHYTRQYGFYFFKQSISYQRRQELLTMFQLSKVRHGAHHLGLALYQPLQLIDSFL